MAPEEVEFLESMVGLHGKAWKKIHAMRPEWSLNASPDNLCRWWIRNRHGRYGDVGRDGNAIGLSQRRKRKRGMIHEEGQSDASAVDDGSVGSTTRLSQSPRRKRKKEVVDEGGASGESDVAEGREEDEQEPVLAATIVEATIDGGGMTDGVGERVETEKETKEGPVTVEGADGDEGACDSRGSVDFAVGGVEGKVEGGMVDEGVEKVETEKEVAVKTYCGEYTCVS